MRLTHIALALTLVLLGVTGYLAWEGQQEARGARQQLELIKKQQQADSMPGNTMMRPPQPGQVAVSPVLSPPPATPGSGIVRSAPGSVSLPPTSPMLAAPAPAPLTALQRQIIAMPTIAKVKHYEKDAGFVVIGAGKTQRISKGTQFDLRRDNAVVGRITIGDTEDEESIGSLDPATVPAGVVVQVGDEAIQVVNP